MAKKKKKPYFYIFASAIIIILIYTIRYFFLNLDTEIVRYGIMEDIFETNALIIRNERVINIPVDAQLKNQIEEGQRVQFGKKLFELIKEDNLDDDLLVKISKLEERISEISKNEEESTILEKDKEKLLKNIEEKIGLVKKYSLEGDLVNLLDVKEKLNADLYKSSLINGENSFSGRNLEQLLNEKNRLKSLYNSNQEAIYANTPGLVSYQLDGLEDFLNPINIKNFKPDEIKATIETYSDVKEDDINIGIKVIEDYKWYLGAIISEEQIKRFKEGNKVKIVFEGREDLYINAKISSISDKQNDDYLVTFETDEYFPNYYKLRVADIKIIIKTLEGFFISTDSIAVNGNEKGVYIIKNGINRFVPIKILGIDDNKALVDNIDKKEENNNSNGYIIKVYDEVVKNSKKVKM